MRRGLLSWSKTEIPHSVFDMRVAQTQAAMATDGIEALLIYVNHTRPAAASWLTGFIPYWSECMLFLPRVGRPTLAAALSKRVHQWIAQTSWIEGIVAAPRLGREIGKLCVASGSGKRTGVLEYDALPTRIADDLTEAGVTDLVDATAMFERLRSSADATEIALAAHAGQIARGALAAIPDGLAGVDDVVAAVEGAARRGGAEEVYVAVASGAREYPSYYRAQGGGGAAGESLGVRLTVAYKGYWVRLSRTLTKSRDAAEAVRRAGERFAEAIARLPDTGSLMNASSWLIEGTTRSLPLEPLAASSGAALPVQTLEGKVVTVTATFDVDGHLVRVVAPVLVGSGRRPGALLAIPLS
jgi:Xaa-Pro aminopeptidase